MYKSFIELFLDGIANDYVQTDHQRQLEVSSGLFLLIKSKIESMT